MRSSARPHPIDSIEPAVQPARLTVTDDQRLLPDADPAGPLIAAHRGLLGWIFLPGSEKKLWLSVPGSQKDLKTSGFPAVASVLDADSKTGLQKYRIDKETRVPDNRISSENVNNFVSLEYTVYDWKPSKADAALKKAISIALIWAH